MSQPAQHIDPGAAFVEAIAQRTAEIMLERLQGRGAAPAVRDLEALGMEGLDLMRAYSAKEVAALLGTQRVDSVYEISEDELPRVRRVGAHIGFLGINVLCYMHGLPPVDMAAAIEAYRAKLENDRPTVLPMRAGKNNMTRVL